jgi:hypothetical protein
LRIQLDPTVELVGLAQHGLYGLVKGLLGLANAIIALQGLLSSWLERKRKGQEPVGKEFLQ